MKLCATCSIADGGSILLLTLPHFPPRSFSPTVQRALPATRPKTKSIMAPSAVGPPMRSETRRGHVFSTSYLRVSDFFSNSQYYRATLVQRAAAAAPCSLTLLRRRRHRGLLLFGAAHHVLLLPRWMPENAARTHVAHV